VVGQVAGRKRACLPQLVVWLIVVILKILPHKSTNDLELAGGRFARSGAPPSVTTFQAFLPSSASHALNMPVKFAPATSLCSMSMYAG
jgi:hypothetical protein